MSKQPIRPVYQRLTPSTVPEPAPKRKTLAERAGEIAGVLAAPPSSRPVNGAVKATTSAGYRNGSHSSSLSAASTRSTASSRNTSLTNSVGSRPATSKRPHTSMSHSRTKSQTPRPATALDTNDPPSLGKRKAWDTKGRLEDIESLYGQLKDQMATSTTKGESMKEQIDVHKTRINELETIRAQLSTRNETLRTELEETRLKLSASETALETTKRTATFETDDMRRKFRNELEDARDQHQRELDQLRDETDRLTRLHKEEKADLEKVLRAEMENERMQRMKEFSELQTRTALAQQNIDVDNEKRERAAQELRHELGEVKSDLERERTLKKSLQDKLSEATSNTMTLESANSAMKAKIDFLQSDNKSQSQAFTDLQKRMQEAIDSAEETKAKLRAEETLRRKLHNQVQELKGNIRVFCRVRPPLGDESNSAAEIAYPDAQADSKEVVITGPEQKSAMGNITRSTNPFAFDRVFGPRAQNAEVFEEISQLVQSALDGYNVCIFCYGQTGSGKTHTMSSLDGMIPRAVAQIYSTAQGLEEKGWTYKMEGQFVEVYNENLNDLLGDAHQFDKKKHEIRHDPAKKQTTITDITTVPLDTPDMVEQMLSNSAKNRSVAATMANSRSSRSHSVFILKLKGSNSITGERSEGTLNLVDLAGSERLSHSGATGDRLKETQNINRSLSCLGDVIGALGQGKEGGHVPYRNSKLTYLLQYSLGGNSKTLMFVMISPLQGHLHETLTSLKFATKVHNTHIGTAKRQAKVKD
ncbi:uncharacterized protein K452DRAFT_223443 [Aplosporella prunicola CBS 121167]|uniref:Kinesin-like protein n=1 Tax=Aplosporella prunicola CBS 121167 TaxID=1176127 RepID=A0A6A6BLL8_9PEZI|nr:uncharacterized protein K452DRAFT_223443 [Aplosporella prunicola CBS 121167]KAF2144174.1 hypothetical protein K452DRAFT_223443 [Aplosporella prunicola CBS 121167]